MTVNYNKLRLWAVGYAILPIIIFYFGWISIGWAVLFSALLAGAFFMLYKNSSSDDGEYTSIEVSKKSIIIVGIISVVWCLLAGQGDFLHQSSDHLVRDAIFRDLVRHPWPVIYREDHMLCYYIAHWMPSAAVGKLVFTITGSSFAGYLTGNIAMLIWTGIGVFLTFMLLTVITARGRKPHIILTAVMFIFFSGLDTIGSLVNWNMSAIHIEWWRVYAQFSSITTCLFWVYNQTIVSWIMTLCIINERKPKNFALLGLLVIPYGPFPFVGVLAICIAKAAVIFIRAAKNGNIKSVLLKDTLTLQNILGTAAIAPVYLLYYSANAIVSNSAYYWNSHQDTGFRLHIIFQQIPVYSAIAGILLFLFIEAGCYVLIILANDKKKKHFNIPFYICMIILAFVPCFQMGSSYDFCMRVSIPLLLYICVEFIGVVMENMPEKSEIKSLDMFVRTKPVLTVAIMVFALGTATPIIEFRREIKATLQSGINIENNYYELESLISWDEINNFAAVGYEDSAYYKVFSKKVSE